MDVLRAAEERRSLRALDAALDAAAKLGCHEGSNGKKFAAAAALRDLLREKKLARVALARAAAAGGSGAPRLGDARALARALGDAYRLDMVKGPAADRARARLAAVAEVARVVVACADAAESRQPRRLEEALEKWERLDAVEEGEEDSPRRSPRSPRRGK